MEYANGARFAAALTAEEGSVTAAIAGVVRSGGEVTVEWFADNSRVDDQIVSLVVALYDSNKKMVDVETVPAETVAGIDSLTDTVTLDCANAEGDLCVKLFLLQGDGSWLPLVEAKSETV